MRLRCGSVLALLLLCAVCLSYGEAYCHGRQPPGLDSSLNSTAKWNRVSQNGDYPQFDPNKVALYAVPNKAPLLTLAVIRHKVKDAKALLVSHANPNEVDSNGWTPLLYAVMNNDVDMIRLLLKHRAHTNFKTKDGDTALSLSVGFMHPIVAEVLLRNDADPNRMGTSGFYPLFEAASMNQMTMVELLIRYRARVDLKGPHGSSVLTMPCGRSGDLCAGVVQFLVKHHADVNSATSSGDTPLMDAAMGNNAGITKILLAAGANRNLKNSKGETAIEIARRHRFDKVISLLSEKR